MDSEMVPILIIPAFFYCIAYITRVISDNRIRREMITNNVAQDLVQKIFLENRGELVSSNLKWGLVLIALGLSLCVIRLANLSDDDPLTYGIVFIFGGAGLLSYYALHKRLHP